MAVVMLLSMLHLWPGVPLANDEEPTEQEKKDLAVELTRKLESDPFWENAKEARSWLTMWVIGVPDITVKVCGSFHGPYFDKNKKYSSELLTQMMYGQAVFIIENPDQADDDFSVYRAGLASSLRAYQSILRAKPKARHEYLDGLVEQLESGDIDAYVRLKMQDCQ